MVFGSGEVRVSPFDLVRLQASEQREDDFLARASFNGHGAVLG